VVVEVAAGAVVVVVSGADPDVHAVARTMRDPANIPNVTRRRRPEELTTTPSALGGRDETSDGQ
jgi:hypothetical protein